jgi:hypothetical protein
MRPRKNSAARPNGSKAARSATSSTPPGRCSDLGITAVEIVASSAGQAAIGAASAAVEGTVTVATVSLEVVGSVLGGLTDL